MKARMARRLRCEGNILEITVRRSRAASVRSVRRASPRPRALGHRHLGVFLVEALVTLEPLAPERVARVHARERVRAARRVAQAYGLVPVDDSLGEVGVGDVAVAEIRANEVGLPRDHPPHVAAPQHHVIQERVGHVRALQVDPGHDGSAEDGGAEVRSAEVAPPQVALGVDGAHEVLVREVLVDVLSLGLQDDLLRAGFELQVHDRGLVHVHHVRRLCLGVVDGDRGDVCHRGDDDGGAEQRAPDPGGLPVGARGFPRAARGRRGIRPRAPGLLRRRTYPARAPRADGSIREE
mmetsp:Transcript_4599/g.18937  ORF Transcript_4599/g.18937 Transcript_4599/m.18937 type:complete len:294 (-) Transcript_4599:107-988(-)